MLRLSRSLKYNFVPTLSCSRDFSQSVDIDHAIRSVFSGESKRKVIEFTENLKTQDHANRNFLLKNIKKKAAVLVPLCKIDEEPAILLTVRTNHLPTHKGQVSFPGGGMNVRKDKSIYDTALRETEEEIGFPRSQIDVWGSISPIPDQNVISAVYPIIGYLGEIQIKDLKPCENEVSKIFSIPLKKFFDPTFCRSTQFRITKSHNTKLNYIMPVFMSDPKVWGLTAIVIDQILPLLLHGHYKKVSKTNLDKRLEYEDRIKHQRGGYVNN